MLSEQLSLEVSLSCEHGHVWSVSYKKAQKSWCRECKSKRKQLIKDLLEQETAKKNQERMLKQEKMLRESRERMHIGENMQKEEVKQEQENTKIVMEEITRIASKYAREYAQKDETCDFA